MYYKCLNIIFACVQPCHYGKASNAKIANDFLILLKSALCLFSMYANHYAVSFQRVQLETIQTQALNPHCNAM